MKLSITTLNFQNWTKNNLVVAFNCFWPVNFSLSTNSYTMSERKFKFRALLSQFLTNKISLKIETILKNAHNTDIQSRKISTSFAKYKKY